MKRTRLLILGYSTFMQKRVLPYIIKNKNIDYCICSKSQKINLKEKIIYNNYIEALSKASPDLVYISLTNNMHFEITKMTLMKGYNVIVDKPISLSLKETNILLKIAKKKSLLLAEATLFQYHKVLTKMMQLCGNRKNITKILTNFSIPGIPNKRDPKELIKLKNDCENDMGSYAAAIIRLFTNNKIYKIKVNREYFNKKAKCVKSFCFASEIGNCEVFGNFKFCATYMSQISLFTKEYTIISPNRVFALPPDQDQYISIIKKNNEKKIKIKKDNCIENFFKKIFTVLNNKNYNFFYELLLADAILRSKIKNS